MKSIISICVGCLYNFCFLLTYSVDRRLIISSTSLYSCLISCFALSSAGPSQLFRNLSVIPVVEILFFPKVLMQLLSWWLQTHCFLYTNKVKPLRDKFHPLLSHFTFENVFHFLFTPCHLSLFFFFFPNAKMYHCGLLPTDSYILLSYDALISPFLGTSPFPHHWLLSPHRKIVKILHSMKTCLKFSLKLYR